MFAQRFVAVATAHHFAVECANGALSVFGLLERDKAKAARLAELLAGLGVPHELLADELAKRLKELDQRVLGHARVEPAHKQLALVDHEAAIGIQLGLVLDVSVVVLQR